MNIRANQDITVGTATAAPGTSQRGAIPARSLAGGVTVDIPVVVINGAKPGPVFWVNGAIHGDEPEGPLACHLAMKQIDPSKLSGAVVLVPVVNPLAFSAAERGNPLDTFTYDMNRIYPGKPNGYFSDRVAHAHWEAMKDIADLEISIHSGGAHSFLDKAIFVDKRPESVELAEATLHEQVSQVRKIFEGLPLIPAIKAAVAAQNADDSYGRVRPPFDPINGAHTAAISEAVRIAGPQANP